jgi:phospholipid:diacylglycerol acyltransferase
LSTVTLLVLDYFLGNYWVFGKILENLADVGYNPSNMAVEPYDWRLAFPVLEERDGYLTKLRYKIESMSSSSSGKREKVVLASHSMGALLVTYFFQWVTTDTSLGGGGGGADWVDRHIQAYVNIAGTHLGVAKAATALLSGEMSETIFPEPMGSMVEQLFGRSLRRSLWSSWGSLWSMLPRGGDALWGIGADLNCTRENNANISMLLNMNDSSIGEMNKDDPFCPRSTHSESLSPLVVMTNDVPNFNIDSDEVNKDSGDQVKGGNANSEKMVCEDNDINATAHDLVSRQKLSIRDILDYLRSYGGGYGKRFSSVQLHSLYKGDDDYDKNDRARPKKSKKMRYGVIPKKAWHDPTQTPLPYAPNLQIYCLYGVGVPTERAYYYKINHDEAGGSGGTTGTTATGTIPQASLLDPPIILDSSINNPDQSVKQGIRYADGDGSVPLLSLGYLCTDAWQRHDSGLNPSNAQVVTREYQHKTEFVVDDPMRGGPYSALHVDVLGNVDMMTDLLRVATGFEKDQVNQDQIVSDIERIAQEINRHPKGGIYGVSSGAGQRKWLGFLQHLK